MASNASGVTDAQSLDDEFYDYYNYTYEYDSSINHLPMHEFLPAVISYGIVGLTGLLGNVLVVVAILNFPRLRSITNVFLLSLATADLLIVLICVPVKGASFFSYTWRMGGFVCMLYAYMQNVSLICSVMTLTVMSIERFMAILFPLKARYICTMTHAKIVILCVWVLSFVMAIPVIFGQKHIEVGSKRKAYWCRLEFDEPIFHQLYELYMFLIMFLIPVVVMAVTYSKICHEIWHVASMRSVMRSGSSECQYKETKGGCTARTVPSISSSASSSARRHPKATRTKSDDARTRKQVVLMLIIVVVMFALCWGPILINNLLVAFGVLHSFHIDYLKPMRMAFHLMSYANSCVNPIVYGFMSKNFRDSFTKALMPCLNRKAKSRASVSDATRVSILKSSNGSDEKDNGFITTDTVTCTTPMNGVISVDMEDIEMR